MSLFFFADCQTLGTQIVSIQFFYDRSMTELWVFRQKVTTSSELGVLLHDKLKEFAESAGPEIVEVPRQLKFLKGEVLHTINLQNDELFTHSTRHLVYVEHALRNQGFATPEKLEIADHIQSYAEVKFLKSYEKFKGLLRKSLGIPLVRPTGFSSRRELLVDAELHKALPEMEEPEEGECRSEDSQK